MSKLCIIKLFGRLWKNKEYKLCSELRWTKGRDCSISIMNSVFSLYITLWFEVMQNEIQLISILVLAKRFFYKKTVC